MHFIIIPTLSKGKKGDNGLLSVLKSICLSIRPDIHSSGQNFADDLSNHWADSLQIKLIGTVLDCSCAMPWLFAPGGIMGMPMGMITLTLSQWSSSGNPVAIQCAWNLDPSVHWNATGERIVGSQCASSGFPVVFHCSNYAN